VPGPPSPGVGAGSSSDLGGDPSASFPFRRILLASDTNPYGPRLRWTVGELAHRFGVELILCHVVMRSTSVAGNELDGSPANPEEVAILTSLRGQLVELLGETGHRVPIKILHGDPGQRICEYAEFSGCDLIVLESREKTLSQRLRGSVSKYVVGAFRRSVLVVED
jgi:nucleotide-binding universal stress UspA family protein